VSDFVISFCAEVAFIIFSLFLYERIFVTFDVHVLTHFKGVSIASFRLYRVGLFASLPLARSRPQISPSEEFRAKCLKFTPRLASADKEFIEYLPQGSTVNIPYRDSTCGASTLPNPVPQDVCRLVYYIHTSKSSGIEFEAWLPINWNNRFLATGNGGLNGCRYSPSYSQSLKKLNSNRS
jgi:hypothetical protein